MKNDTPAAYGTALALRLKEKGFTPESFAQLCQVDPDDIWGILDGEIEPTFLERYAIDALLGSSTYERRRLEWSGKTLGQLMRANPEMTRQAISIYASKKGIPLLLGTDHKLSERQAKWPGRRIREIAEEESMTPAAISYYARKHGIKLVPGEKGIATDMAKLQLRKQTWTGRRMSDIARHEGLSTSTVFYYAKRNGIQISNSVRTHENA